MSSIKNSRKKIWGILILIALILFDQLTKILAIIMLKDKDPFSIIEGVFELQYLENRGAAFGMLQGKRIFFIILTIVVVGLCLFAYFKMPSTLKYLPMRGTTILLCAGAIGNFLDRLIRAYVVDFFYFKLINFPIFNVADIYVSVAAVFLVILVLFVYKDEDFKGVFS